MSQVKKAVIPVAGLGTRMLPATKAIPKEMLPVVDKTPDPICGGRMRSCGYQRNYFGYSRE